MGKRYHGDGTFEYKVAHEIGKCSAILAAEEDNPDGMDRIIAGEESLPMRAYEQIPGLGTSLLVKQDF